MQTTPFQPLLPIQMVKKYLQFPVGIMHSYLFYQQDAILHFFGYLAPYFTLNAK